MKQLLTLILTFVSLFSFGQELSIPNGYEILTEKIGDLDKDGINEKVVVYNTLDSTVSGTVREIQILKSSNGIWIEWKKSRSAVLKSEEGGTMGDPFEEVEIRDGILIISHSGGTSWRWGYTDKYRFQNNEFELIGHRNVFGKVCEYWVSLDFNISTGRIEYKKEFEDCDKEQKIYKTEHETFYKKGVEINLSSRNLKEIKIESPKYKYTLYL